MYTIRPYSEKDYEVINGWYKTINQQSPTKEMFPFETTFILEVKDIPSVALSVILTNSKEFAFIENFVADPILKNRKDATQTLLDAAFSFIKALGYKRAVGVCNEPKLVERYKKMGFTHVQPKQYFLSKEVI